MFRFVHACVVNVIHAKALPCSFLYIKDWINVKSESYICIGRNVSKLTNLEKWLPQIYTRPGYTPPPKFPYWKTNTSNILDGWMEQKLGPNPCRRKGRSTLWNDRKYNKCCQLTFDFLNDPLVSSSWFGRYMCKKINSRLASKFSKQKLPSVKTVHFLLVFDFHLGAVRINTRAPAYILKARILTPTILQKKLNFLQICPKMPQNGPKMAEMTQSGPNMTQHGPKWFRKLFRF